MNIEPLYYVHTVPGEQQKQNLLVLHISYETWRLPEVENMFVLNNLKQDIIVNSAQPQTI